ncbi:hypothetical protein GOP47_0013696 [Adiantum capillus-veneris]|uniref:Transmembrane protein n=1 Tax=Adiantum capillus-veneris TaxID=13818 RepID=A0A9D4UP08_ADICA|nr:hypothetical protein GOP47_0013696 [Adiantum capillus-veneris]
MASSCAPSSSLLGSPLLQPSRHRYLRAFNPRHLSTRGRKPRRGSSQHTIVALFGGNAGGDPGKDKKKFITKKEEPEQYWQSAAEKEGRGPMSTILPYIVIFGFLTPFIILGLGFANGWIKVPVR